VLGLLWLGTRPQTGPLAGSLGSGAQTYQLIVVINVPT
jgi:hypothetical protein